MRIGIMTLWQTEHNYGAILQCYALQQYLKKFGAQPYLIRYRELPKKPRGLVRKFASCIKKMSQKVSGLGIKDEPRHFDTFINDYMKVSEKEYIGYDALIKNPPDADIYIAGSDQIWNFYNCPLEYCHDNIHAYFLDFGNDEVKRYSYAASWDKKFVTDEQLKEIKPLIKKFDYVSVREKEGIELCQICGMDKAELVPDPTLLLSANDYRSIYKAEIKKIRRIPNGYIFVYLVLTQKQRYDLDTLYAYAATKNLEVIYIAEDKTPDKYRKYYPSIPEWLYLIDNAQYVVTNSFHGTVFSLLFHKQYATIPLNGYSQATNARIYSVCELFNTEPRFVNLKGADFSILDKDYSTSFIKFNNTFDKYITGGGYC